MKLAHMLLSVMTIMMMMMMTEAIAEPKTFLIETADKGFLGY